MMDILTGQAKLWELIFNHTPYSGIDSKHTHDQLLVDSLPRGEWWKSSTRFATWIYQVIGKNVNMIKIEKPKKPGIVCHINIFVTCESIYLIAHLEISKIIEWQQSNLRASTTFVVRVEKAVCRNGIVKPQKALEIRRVLDPTLKSTSMASRIK